MRKSNPGGLVYSTEGGRMCPTCRQPLAQCQCHNAKLVPAGDGVVRVSRSSKGRGGKTVTLVQGLPLPADELAALGKRLRTACGAGGPENVLEVRVTTCPCAGPAAGQGLVSSRWLSRFERSRSGCA
jgi:translation initiation factor 1